MLKVAFLLASSICFIIFACFIMVQHPSQPFFSNVEMDGATTSWVLTSTLGNKWIMADAQGYNSVVLGFEHRSH